jgi:hypothetical protein
VFEFPGAQGSVMNHVAVRYRNLFAFLDVAHSVNSLAINSAVVSEACIGVAVVIEASSIGEDACAVADFHAVHLKDGN